jgi:hypothetical protein
MKIRTRHLTAATGWLLIGCILSDVIIMSDIHVNSNFRPINVREKLRASNMNNHEDFMSCDWSDLAREVCGHSPRAGFSRTVDGFWSSRPQSPACRNRKQTCVIGEKYANYPDSCPYKTK